MRLLYTTLFTLLLPLVILRLYWRGVKAPAYRQRWLERLGWYSEKPELGAVWVHAVSVGEVEAAIPLINNLLEQYPQQPVLVTTTTPTGSARVQALLGDKVQHVYFPYDLPWVVSRTLERFKPAMLVVMEKEIWPNLYATCKTQNIPVFIVNARLSVKSGKLYKMITPLIKPVLENVNAVLAQTEEDAQRFVELGAPQNETHVTGNIKFDINIDEASLQEGMLLKRTLFPGRFVLIAASTHEGEEDIFLNLYAQLKQHIPELILLLVPRHPERFAAVIDLAKENQLKVVNRTGDDFCKNETDVYIADTMGELKMFYAAADLAFVGGSLVPVGGHNILEPLAIGVPVMFGPHMHNFQEISDLALSENIAVQCNDNAQIVERVIDLYQQEATRLEMVQHGHAFIQQNQGVTEMIFDYLDNFDRFVADKVRRAV